MRKLIIQVPCLNEEAQLPATLSDLPRSVPGFDIVEWLVIDDGSTDRTIQVARAHGVDHVVKLTSNKGLATAFQAGLDAALKLGADVIVNTDADNQYAAADIATLVVPIVAGRADLVIGDRNVLAIEHFSSTKKRMQRLGSWVVRRASNTSVPDVTSGFRAYNRDAALGVVVVSHFTYTLESLIQAGKGLLAVDHVPVATNPVTRESRLLPSMWSYVRRNALSVVRIYAAYEPLRVFGTIAGVLSVAALAAWSPYLYDWLVNGDRSGHLQSIILGGVLLLAAVQVLALGILADLVSANRAVSHRILERVRRLELAAGVEPSHYTPGPGPHQPVPPAPPVDLEADAAARGFTSRGMTLAPELRLTEDADLVPRWFARLIVVVLALVTGYGGIGLGLALAGLCTPVAVGLVGTLAVIGLVLLGWSLDSHPSRPGQWAWPGLALVLTLGWVMLNAPYAGQHVIVNRDPGVYLVAGRWIADHGTLVVDAGVGPFAGAEGVLLESAGTYDEGRGRLDIQFNHLVPVLLAEIHWLGGDRAMTMLPVFMGGAALLTTFALATRLTGRAWAGFVVASCLAVCLPVVAAVRDTYSEAAAWLFLTGGLWVWTRASDEARVSLAAVGGLVLGAVAITRVDGIVYLLPVPVMLGMLAAGPAAATSQRARWTASAFAVGIAPGVVVSAFDVLMRSREYYRDLRSEILMLWAALAISTAMGWMVSRRASSRLSGKAPGFAVWACRRRKLLAAGGAFAVVIVGTFAWFVRPRVQVARSSGAFQYIGAIQAGEGQPEEPNRRYDERSLEWMAWYVGPVTVALAVGGGALVARRSIAQGVTPTLIAWLVLAGGTVLYLWRPSITPDQIWASRRFVPAAFPLVVTLAGVSAVAAVDEVRRRIAHPTLLALASGAALAVAVVGPAAARTRPVARLSDQHGYLELVDDLCVAVGSGAVLAIDGERAGITLPQTLRSFCGVPVGLLVDDDATPARVQALANAWAAEGRALHVVGGSAELVASLVPGGLVTALGPFTTDQALEVTVTRPPGRLVEVSDTLYITAVPGTR